jgi:hypothetical protein
LIISARNQKLFYRREAAVLQGKQSFFEVGQRKLALHKNLGKEAISLN